MQGTDFLLMEPANSGTVGPTTVSELPVTGIADGEVFIVRNYESRYLTHLYHKYAGKFMPALPKWAMARYLGDKPQSVVLDPFVGSGTTLVEALLAGHHGYGIDIDPLARLIAKVKTTHLPTSRVATLFNDTMRRIRDTKNGTWVPLVPNLRHWFTDKAISDLSTLLHVVESFCDEPDVHDFLLICFSSVIRRASNADNQTMKTYVSHTNIKVPEDVFHLFESQLRVYIDRIKQLAVVVTKNGSSHLLDNTDARSFGTKWKESTLPPVDLIITSPPYIKSVDYIYNQMVELFWIGKRWDLESQVKQNAFKKRYIGSERELKTTAPGVTNQHITAHFSLETLEKTSPTMFAIAQRYFTSMYEHFYSASKVLRPNGHYILVVGGSTLAGISLPTPDLLCMCAAKLGFRRVLHFAYEIRNKHMRFPRGGNGGEISHDWVIDLVLES